MGDTFRTRATIALTTVLLATLAACSSSSDDKTGTTSSSPATAAETPTTAPTVPDAIELERVADTYVNLYFGGACEGAYAFLSKRCRAKADPATYAATVGQAAKDYGPDHPATDVHATVSGAMGRISYKVKGLPNFDQQGQPWTVEGGAWKYDAC
jgi:ABC-type Fe3+-hydroxamate transport system substrate-binding protein